MPGASRAPAPDWPPPRSRPGAPRSAEPEAGAGVAGPGRPIAVPEPEGLASAPNPKPTLGVWPGSAHHALRAHQHPDPHGEYPAWPVSGSRPGLGDCGRTLAPPSWTARPDTPPRAWGGGWDPTLPRSRNSQLWPAWRLRDSASMGACGCSRLPRGNPGLTRATPTALHEPLRRGLGWGRRRGNLRRRGLEKDVLRPVQDPPQPPAAPRSTSRESCP